MAPFVGSGWRLANTSAKLFTRAARLAKSPSEAADPAEERPREFVERPSRPSRRRQKRRSLFADYHRGVPKLLSRSAIFQPLEERVMLDIGGPNSQPPTIVVGRTLSAYDVPDVQNNQETLTFTAYNQAADPISGVLLTDTLAPGVTFASASQLPDQNGQDLAWSLGTIQPYERASVTLTVSLASPTPTTLDTGASAYGTLDAGMVSWTTAPATLRATAITTDQLASTPDANTTDPYVQEKAAELDYDPQRIYAFLQNNIGYNSYVGSLRGARGTLWSNAGNALDDASLGVALMRASGIPAQYEEGTLSTPQAQQLILSMFPASYQTVGYIPAGTQTADPANDPQLLSETKDHFWLQFDAGSGMQDADPEFAGQSVGQTATTSSNNFTEVPDALRQKTEVKLDAEIENTAASLFGLGGPSRTTVLDQTFNDVDLVGVPLSVGNFVSAQGISAIFSDSTFTYSPYIRLGDGRMPSLDTIIRGKDYQETYTSFPFGSQILTGVFLNVSLQSAEVNGQRQTVTATKTLLDRIGVSERQSGAPISLNLPSAPALAMSPLDIVTFQVSAEMQSVAALAVQTAIVAKLSAQDRPVMPSGAQSQPNQATALGVSLSGLNALTTQEITETSSLLGETFLADSDLADSGMAPPLFAQVYFDVPRLAAASSTFAYDPTNQSGKLTYGIDILSDSPRVVLAPGQSEAMEQAFHFVHGLSDSAIEGEVLQPLKAGSGAESSSAMTTFLAGLRAGPIALLLAPSDTAELDQLPIPADTKARIAAAVDGGMLAVVPLTPVLVNGVATIAWLEINPASGDALAVTAQGTHGAFTSYETAELISTDAVLAAEAGASEAGATAAATAAADDGGLLVIEAAEQRALAQGLARAAVKQAALDALFEYWSVTNKFIIANYKFNGRVGVLAANFFKKAFSDRIDFLGRAVQKEPPLADILVAPSPSGFLSSKASAPLASARALTPGSVIGTARISNLQAVGSLDVSWHETSQARFAATSLNAASATVTDANNNVIGSGRVAVTSTSAVELRTSGNNDYSVNGTGSLSFYGPAKSGLGVSGNWDNYTGTLNGSVAIRLTTDDLTINGQILPFGTYTISTNSATLLGSGLTSSPNFAGSASITATAVAVQLGPGTGNLTVGGTPLAATNETTLIGYSGTVDVSANGDGTDSATLNGSAVNVLTLAPGPATVTTDQNTPVSFNAGVNTSFADTYNLTANAPTGWIVTIDNSGKITVTPAPGTQGGTYPIQVIAQSTTDTDLVSQATVEVTITPTLPGMMFSVAPDVLITVPFNGAQVPSAFQATIQNTGPAADTYNLTFGSAPSGFTIVSSTSNVTVPAGQTGINGIYLVPNGTQLPPPGTDLSFSVTATSTADPTITKTVNVHFVMPTIDAVTVASNPAQVTSTPGTPTTATLTITNVGNVPASAALSSSTDSGLIADGLPSTPVSVAVGQSVTQTITLTPDAGAALNSTLIATVNAGVAASQDSVSVLAVSPRPEGAGAPAPQGFFAAGQTVEVRADLLVGVLNPRQALMGYTVKNAAGATVFTSTPVAVTLGALPADNTIDLGALDTTGFPAGQYTIDVAVTETNGQPVPGGAGSGTLVIGSPIAAGLTVDAETVAPGTSTVTSTLTVANQPLLGSVATDGTAASVAVSGNLAYVAGDKDINVVDISNPANPTIVGTFGTGKLNSLGTNFIQVAGGNLLVATQDQSNSNSFDVLVYSLANPTSPQLTGNVTVPYRYVVGMTVEGTTAYLTTHGITYDPSSGSIGTQFGDVAAVDFSNPAAPTFSGVLFNDLGLPDGHNGWEYDAVPVTSSLAYVAGSTSTGANTQTGTGRVLVVNTSPPGTLSVATALDLPGTVQALAIAIDGNTALVVGSSGGLLSPFGDASNIQLTGNVTLTLLDISDPANPKIIGSTIVTPETFVNAGESPVGKFDAISLGGNRFAINGTLLNGGFVVLTVDASTPANLALSTYSVTSPVSGLALSGNSLLATGANGLQVLQANALATTSVTAEVDVPNTGATIDLNSFSTPPTSITPGANSSALVWKLSLAPGGSQQITWTSTVDLTNGQVQPVATGASVQFTGSLSGTAGATLTLPAVSVVAIEAPQTVQIPLLVRSAQTVAISQSSVDATSAGNGQLGGTLSDLGDTISQLQATPTDPNLLNRTQHLLGNLASELGGDPALQPFVAPLQPIQAKAASGDVTGLLAALPAFFNNVDAVLAVEAAEQFTVSVSPNEIDLPALANQQKTLAVQISNTGPAPETLKLGTGALPSGVTATLGQTQITLQPGASQTVNLTLTSNLVSTHVFTLDVRATDNTDSTLATISHDGTATVAVRAAAADVLGVTVNPITVTAGTPVSVSASIFNTANATRSVLAHLEVLDSTNKVVASPADVPLALTPTASAVTFSLGRLDTTVLANGVYTLAVSLRATDGSTLPGKTSEAPFLVGLPISASVSASPTTLPPGTSNVTTTITVTNQGSGTTSQNTQVDQTAGGGDGSGGSIVAPTLRGGDVVAAGDGSGAGESVSHGQANSDSGSPPQSVGAPLVGAPLVGAPLVAATVAAPTPPAPPAFSPPAGDAVTWVGAASGNWSVAANWLDTTTGANHVPDATDNVTIDASGLTITVSTGAQVAQSLLLKSGSTLALTGGTLSMTAGSELDGAVTLGGNTTLMLGGGATLKSTLNWTAGTIDLGGGNLFNLGTMTLGANTVGIVSTNGGNTRNLGGKLINEGTVVEQAGSLYVYDGIVLDNTSQGTWQFGGDGGIGLGNFTPTIVNSGAFQKTGGTGTSYIELSMASTDGTFEADSGTLVWTVPGDTFDGGTFNAAAGAAINLNYGNFDFFTGTFTGSGAGAVLPTNTMDIGGGGATFDFAPGLFQWSNATINLQGNTLTNTGSMTLGLATQGTGESITSRDANLNPLNGTFDNQGTLTAVGPTRVTLYDNTVLNNAAQGSLLFAGDGGIFFGGQTPSFTSAGTIEKTSGTGTSQIAVSFNYTGGPLKVDSGTIMLNTGDGQLAGTSFSVATGATLDLAGNTSRNVFNGTFTGTGGGTVLLENGAIVVGAGGATFDFPAGMLQWTGGSINLDGETLTNTGAITLANANNVSLIANDQFTQKNDFNLGGTFNNTGTITEQAAGGLGLYDSVALDNQVGGTYNFASDAGFFSGGNVPLLTNAGTMKKSAGTGISIIAVPFSNAGGTLDVASGTLSVAGNGGTSTGGTSTGGTFTVATGDALELAGNNTNASVYTGTYTGTGGGAVSIGSGSIVIGAAGATFNFPAGLFQWTAGGINLDGNTLTNTGSMTVANTNNVTLFGNGNFPGGSQNGGNQGGTLDNQGTITDQGPAAILLYDSVLLKNDAAANVSLSGGASLIFQNDSPTINNVGALSVNDATGISTISVALTNSGTVTVAKGELDLTNSVTNSGTLDAQANTLKFTYPIANTGTIQTAGGTLAFDEPNDRNYSITNSGTIAVDGGSATFTGPITQDANGYLSGGTWIAAGGGTITLPTNSSIAVNEGKIVLSGTGSTIAGIQPLVANEGALSITSGATFATAGDFTNSGLLALGPDSTLSVNGNYTQTAVGTLDEQLGGTPASGHFGKLAVTGAATLAGMLRSEFVAGYVPVAGDNFTIASYAGTSGSFGSVALAETPTVAYAANVGAASLVLASQAATLKPTQVAVTSSAPAGASYGQLVQYTATVTTTGGGTPTGAVQFQIDGLSSGLPVALSSGQAALTIALPAGTHSVAADYISGNAQFANSDDSASPLTEVVAPAAVKPTSIELYYTTYGGPSSVDKVAINFDQATLTLGTPTAIVQNVPADGLIFLPNGDLMTAAGAASEVNPNTGAVTTENQVSGDHLALDPSGRFVWTSPQPGPLYKLPIDPLGPAVQETLTGDDTQVTHLAFDSAGQAYYVSSGPGGNGSFGLIDLTTFTTKRIYNNLPAAHGISYDPYTGDLFLVGSDSIVQIDPRTLKIVSERDFPTLGSVFDQGANDGKGHLYAANNGGYLVFIDYSGTGLVGDPSDFVATPFLATALDDVAPLSGLGGAGIPVTVNHQLPSTGYIVNPTSITPSPASFNSTDVTWQTTFTPGQPETDQFQLTGQATNMAPGEVRQISDGTTVTATVTAQDGTQIPISIDLPPVVVAAQHIIELTPPTDTVDQGATAAYTVELSNPLPTDEFYTLSVDGLPNGENASLAASVSVPAGQTIDVPLTVSVPVGSLPGTQAFLVSAQTAEGASDSVEGQLAVTANVAVSSLAVNLVLTPAKAVAGQTNPATYTITITNTGDTTDTYNLSAALPQGFTGSFSPTTITVPPGLSNFRDVQLMVTPAAGAAAQDYPFTVTASSTTDGTVKSQAGGTATVVSAGVQVQLTPSSSVPGGTYQLKVTNTGSVADTFNLSLASPGALVSTLGTNQVTLQPGASQTVPVTTSAVTFADAGTLPLTGIATSQTNTAVRDQSTADLTIASTQSMTAAFNPSTQTLSLPGDTSSLLLVNNTGNTEDSYSATIVSTTGPITANLVGLDGQPAQSVPLFILPGLATGAILLQVHDTGTGQGTVTVLVQSLTNGSVQAAPTATITVGSTVTPPAALTLVNNTGLAVAEGSSATLTGAMLQSTDSDSSVIPTDIVYTLTAAPSQGGLTLSGQSLAMGSTFTQDDINSGRLVYQAAEEGADSFGFSISAGAAASISGTALIANSDPAVGATGGFTVSATEGAATTLQTVATFTDAGGFEPQASYTADIDWGDGMSTTGNITLPTTGGVATVSGQHTYAEQGSYTVHVVLHHEGSPTATATSTAVVSDPAVAGSGGFAYSGTEGSTAAPQTVAVFTDPGGAEAIGDYAASIDWGDGTDDAGTISVDPNTHIFTVSGRHSYAQNGSYPIQVAVRHEAAPTVTVTSTAQIAETASLGGTGIAAAAVAVTGNERGPLTGVSVATFTDGDGSLPAADFTATIDWGDGVTSTGSVTLAGATYAVSGSHTYLDEGHYTFKVTVDQTIGGSSSASVTADATIHEELLMEGTAGTPNQRYINEIYRDVFDREAEPQGREYWVAQLAQGKSRLQVATEIVQTAFPREFQRGAVDQLYQAYLGRAPDANGKEYWTAFLYGKGTVEEMAQALVMSPEFYQKAGGTADGFLNALFHDALGRGIDVAAKAYFENALTHGGSRDAIAAAVFGSDEFLRLRAGDLYEQVLDRPADPSGAEYYAQQLAHGTTDEQILAQLIASDEYFAKAEI